MRILLAGVPKYQLDWLHSVLNVAARMIFGYSRYDHITPLLRDRLHWLRVTQRIDFKRCLMVFKALHCLAPGYISDYCIRVSTNQPRSSLRSASHNCLVVPPPSKRCIVAPQATSRTIVSESRQSSGDRVYVLQVTTVWLCRPVRDYQVWRTFIRNLRSHYVELAARQCKTRRLHRRDQVETENLCI